MATLRIRGYVEGAESYGGLPPITRSESHRPTAAIEAHQATVVSDADDMRRLLESLNARIAVPSPCEGGC